MTSVTRRHVKIVAKLAKRFQEQENTQENSESPFYIPHAEKIVNEILKLCCLNEFQARKLLDLIYHSTLPMKVTLRICLCQPLQKMVFLYVKQDTKCIITVTAQRQTQVEMSYQSMQEEQSSCL